MSPWFKSKVKHAGSTVLALDIGTEFIKALILRAENEKGKVMGVSKMHQNPGDMHNGTITDIASVIRTCKEAIAQAIQMSGVLPDHLILGIAGDLIKGSSRTIRYRRHQPQGKIHLEELKNIIHKVQWKAFEQIRAELAQETGYNEIDIKLVSASIMEIRIDDYKVNNPIGFQGNEVVVTIFNAFSPLVHYGVLQSIVAELNIDLLAMTSEPYALSRALHSEKGSGLNAIIMDIGGGTTDLALVRDGILEGSRMFTIGGRSFTKRISHNLNISFVEAEEVKLAYSASRLEKQSQKIVADALKKDCEVWLTGITLTLNEFASVNTLPSSILLCGGGSHLPEIKTILSEGDWWKALPFDLKPQVNFLQPQTIGDIKDETHLLQEMEDVTPLALGYTGIQFLEDEKSLGKILRKVVRLMQV
ncbi:MAG: cell division protein (septum formation) [uncultured bacterium]|nr:MAG: cell division protein (septum formation) [uncultured bacterium]